MLLELFLRSKVRGSSSVARSVGIFCSSLDFLAEASLGSFLP